MDANKRKRVVDMFRQRRVTNQTSITHVMGGILLREENDHLQKKIATLEKENINLQQELEQERITNFETCESCWDQERL